MKCPLCQSELTVKKQENYNYDEISCPTDLSILDRVLSYYNTHYHRYAEANWSHFTKIEDMFLYPYKISNYDITYSERRKTVNGQLIDYTPSRQVFYCSIKKYNPNRVDKTGLLHPGYERLVQLSEHIHPDIEEKLRERIKRIILLS